MIRLIVSGCNGRMGSRILSLASEDEDFQIIGALEAKGNPGVGSEILPGIKISSSLDGIIRETDVLIEFTTPEATVEHLEIVRQAKKAMVIGTTGLTASQMNEVKKAAQTIPILMSPNMSVGVNVLFRAVRQVARQLGATYDIEITEAHHRQKKDAPSGTAKRLAEEIASALGIEPSKIPIHSVRVGDIVGDHTVIFAGPGERIELTHRAHSRDTFAQGALRAAKFIVNQKPGLYDMRDVLT